MGLDDPSVSFLLLLNKWPQISGLNTNALSYSYVGQKSDMSLTGLKSGLGVENDLVLLFSLLGASCAWNTSLFIPVSVIIEGLVFFLVL